MALVVAHVQCASSLRSASPVLPSKSGVQALRSSLLGSPAGHRGDSPSLRHPGASPLPAHRGARASPLPLVTAAVTTSPAGQDFVSSIAGFFRRLMPVGPMPEQGGEEGDGGDTPLPRRKVAVLGATGKTGRQVVAKLLEAGHAVTALVSSTDRAKEVLESDMGLALGDKGPKAVRLVEGTVQDPDALRALFSGNDAVVCCVGSFSGSKDSQSSSPETVDWLGVREAARIAAEVLEEGGRDASLAGQTETVLDFSGLKAGQSVPANGAAARGEYDEGERLPGWTRRDDVIMGGQSSSTIRAGDGYAVFEGVIRVEGGGFCGATTVLPSPVDASPFDGLALRVRGDGKRYKLNVSGTQQLGGPVKYQASFDTVRGRWIDVFVPFSSFQAVNKGTRLEGAQPLEVSALAEVMFLQSRFQYDGFPNPLSSGGPFCLEVESISLVRQPRTQFVLLSSASVERSARAVTPEERQQSIPIVQLNPAGVLSWKLSGEDALRASGLRYTVVRPCGLTDKDEDQSFILESAQGDAITGLISRPETAAVCVEALESPYAADVTFEVRRDDLSKGLAMAQRHWTSLFSRLRPDTPAPPVLYPAVPAELMAANKE